MKALVTAEVIKEELEKVKNVQFEYAGYNINHEVMDREELKEKIKDKDILICEYDTIDKEILEVAENLKLIICCRGGYKTVIDTEVAKEKNIIVCNTAGRNANAVADMTMGYILNMTRNITLTNNLIHNKKITMDFSTKPKEYKDTVWGLDNNSPFIKYRGRSINYMTLGLVGYGAVGHKLAPKAQAFGMNVIAYDPYCKNANADNVKLVSFEELLKQSDIISLHCPKTEETKNLFNKETILQMKQNSYLINTSRGGIVDEEALVEMLKNEHLAGAALDVTLVEPISDDSILVNAPNLILTPHIGGSSYDVQKEGTDMIIKSLNDWFEGKKPYNCVINGGE